MSRRLLPLVALFVLPLVPTPALAQDRAELANRLVQLPGELARSKKSDAECVDALFLATLVRLPKDNEREVATKHLARAKDREQGLQDLTWALVNTKEFLKLHGLDKDVNAGLEFVNSISAAWEKKEKR